MPLGFITMFEKARSDSQDETPVCYESEYAIRNFHYSEKGRALVNGEKQTLPLSSYLREDEYYDFQI